MADFTSNKINKTYQRIVQVDNATLQDGYGRILSGSMADLTVNGVLQVTGSLNVDGPVTARRFIATQVTSSIIYESGSTKYGDTQDDNHTFTGSLLISGSENLVGDLTITGSTFQVGNTTKFGNIELTGNITQAGNYTIVGNTEQTGSVDLLGDTNQTGNVNQEGNFGLTGASNHVGLYKHIGDTEQTGKFVQVGDTEKTGRTDHTGRFNNIGDFDLIGGERHTGNLIRVGKSTQEGDSTLIGKSSITGSLVNSGSLTSIGVTTLSGEVNITGSTDINISGSITQVGELERTGSTNQLGSFTVVGDTSLTGTVSITGSTDVYISGSIVQEGNVTQTGNYNLTGDIAQTGDIDVTGNVNIDGVLTANRYITSIVSSSVIYQSGSTQFGDTLDDQHNITGSLSVTGSLTTNGNSTVSGSSFIQHRMTSNAVDTKYVMSPKTVNDVVVPPNYNMRVFHDTIVDGELYISEGSDVYVPVEDGRDDPLLSSSLHPSYDQVSFSVDTGGLTGAYVVSDIDINVGTDNLGHLVEASGSVLTRKLTLQDLGYSGSNDANTYVHPTFSPDDYSIGTGNLTGATVISKLDVTLSTNNEGHVTDSHGAFSTRELQLSDLTGTIDLASQVNGILPATNMAAIALTTVQEASSQVAHLALTTEEGDVVVRSDENRSYVHNGGTAGTMADFTLLATPTDAVLSVNGQTGAVTVGDAKLASDQIFTGYNRFHGDFRVDTTNKIELGDWNGVGANGTYLEIDDSAAAVTVQNGDFRATGDVIAFYTSDKKFKDNIEQLDGALEKIKQIRGVRFDWNDKQSTHTGHDIGVIAQEVEAVYPELVHDRQKNNSKAVDYVKLSAVLIEAVKELSAKVEELENKIK